ncbi:amyloid-beta-like protein [Condylostylus longicornis]|uniref:amyloid-beta-like protein n=1 Tax=Condylostylus longicornis TaxID=2530218 RepID=UPI00244DBE45|nr:amyloid-beta-like protein [Condylostylus longicornis]XP_055374796.1 amyloid-beta-like protein [Condylostylus longicornis]XP_055374797.1 amyloid-beta-like protein [Condylostylus longicornis]XP_055374799.1 amyloid-beta-like protein [Condylostylus longicornis]
MMLITILSALLLVSSSGFVESASPRWEPQISVLCEAGQVFQPQYLTEEGRWSTDLKIKTPSTCLRDRMDLLDYCKKVSKYEIYGRKSFKI